jgi:hypothetical protein
MKNLAIVALALLPLSLPAQAQAPGVQLGMLTCAIDGGVGFFLGSSKNMRCTFRPANNRLPQQSYIGVMNKYGVDIGATSGGVLQWLVLAPSFDVYAPNVLSGNYVGANAEATIAWGVGANVLLGGGNSIALQPLSVQGQTGLNAALTVGELSLRGTAS